MGAVQVYPVDYVQQISIGKEYLGPGTIRPNHSFANLGQQRCQGSSHSGHHGDSIAEKEGHDDGDGNEGESTKLGNPAEDHIGKRTVEAIDGQVNAAFIHQHQDGDAGDQQGAVNQPDSLLICKQANFWKRW